MVYVRCLKEKNERNEIVCFYCTQSYILLCGIAMFRRGNRTNQENFSLKNETKLRTASLKQNLLVLIKKKSVNKELNKNLFSSF